jgi:hypothetical protein
MTEIDVPDWVVEAALLATSDPSETSLTHAEYARAIITAALGAWVVPVMWKHERCGWTPINEALIATRGQINYAYTLRQEKPE